MAESNTSLYRLLVKVVDRPNNNSAYVFYKTYESDGTSTIYETSDTDDLNNLIESMINGGITVGGRKFKPKVDDLVVVRVYDWYADAVSDVLSNNLKIATEEDITEVVDDLFNEIVGSIDTGTASGNSDGGDNETGAADGSTTDDGSSDSESGGDGGAESGTGDTGA